MKSSRSLAREWPYARRRTLERALREAAAAWFAARNLETSRTMPYCLARGEDWPQNILLPEVTTYVQGEKSRCERAGTPYPLHKYLHHGLSSQAHAFNLVGPLVVRNDLQPLGEAIAAHGVQWPGADAKVEFEFEDRSVFNEDSGQPTSIDIVVRDERGAPTIFIEHKLIEPEFGGCSVYGSGDCDGRSPARDHGLCYLHHVGRTYWDRMDELGFADMLHEAQPCPLAVHYQFFREALLAIVKGGTFVLLSDERSPAFHTVPSTGGGPARGLMPYLSTFVPPQHRGRVVSISVGDVVDAIRRSGRHDDWLGDYCAKYARG